MSIITAISDGSNIWLGNNNARKIGDTPLSDGFDPWIKFGDWALGVTGEGYQQDLIRLNLKELEEKSQSSLTLINFIRNLFLDNEVSFRIDEDAAPSFGVWCILANKKHALIWDVDQCLSLSSVSKNKVWANGSGVDFALGADFACLKVKPKTPPQDRIRIATEAAISNDINCPGIPIVSHFT